MAAPTPQSLEHFFAALSKRQTMLLLTSVTFGGQDAPEGFEHLPDEEAELLKHRAGELLQIPREKRIPLLVQEIKRLVTARRGQLWAADPGRLASLLKQERPALVEVLLRALPASLADSVREFLPPRKVSLAREVKPEVLNIIRWKLEELLTREAPKRAVFKFSDVLLLQSRELFTVCDRLGARGLALAVAGLAEEARNGLLEKLPPDQRATLQRALVAAGARSLKEEDAQELLALHGADENPSAALRSAGVQRLARACLAQSAEFAARVLERHRGEFGQLFAKWVREERQRAVNLGDGGRADIVAELERLETKGVIDRPIRLPPPKKRLPAVQPTPAHERLPGGRVLPPPVQKLAERSEHERRESSRVGADPRREASRAALDPRREASRAAVDPRREGSRAEVDPRREASRAAVDPRREASRAAVDPRREASRAALDPRREASRAAVDPRREGSRAEVDPRRAERSVAREDPRGRPGEIPRTELPNEDRRRSQGTEDRRRGPSMGFSGPERRGQADRRIRPSLAQEDDDEGSSTDTQDESRGSEGRPDRMRVRNYVEPSPGPRRDFMAERAARAAGAQGRPGPDAAPRRDLMAERAARRAGAASLAPEPRSARPPPEEPELVDLPENPREDNRPRSQEGTALDRPGRPGRPGSGRGPKGGSGVG